MMRRQDITPLPNLTMQKEIKKLGKTHITVSRPWGLFARNGHRMLCSDGKIRSIESAESADTFFSVPGRVRIKGKWFTGYWSQETKCWTNQNQSDFPQVYCFRHHTGKGCPLPEWPDTDRLNALVDKAI